MLVVLVAAAKAHAVSPQKLYHIAGQMSVAFVGFVALQQGGSDRFARGPLSLAAVAATTLLLKLPPLTPAVAAERFEDYVATLDPSTTTSIDKDNDGSLSGASVAASVG